MREGILQRASSKRKKTCKLYSLNDDHDEDNETPTNDEQSDEQQYEEKVIKQGYCSKVWLIFLKFLKSLAFGKFSTKFYYKKG